MTLQVQAAQVTVTTASGTGATPIIPASGLNFRYRDLVGLVITTVNAAIATLTISDGNKTVFVLDYPNAASAPSYPLELLFCDIPVQQSGNGNAAWTITPSVNGTSFHITAQWVER